MTGSGRVAGEVSLERAAVAQAHEGLVQHLPKRDLASVSKGVTGRHHQDKLVGLERQGLQGTEINRIGDDAEVGEPTRDGRNDLAARPLFHEQRSLAVGCLCAMRTTSSLDHPFRQGPGMEFGVRAERGRWLHPVRSRHRHYGGGWRSGGSYTWP